MVNLMPEATISHETLKQAMKEAFIEALSEQRDLVREVIAEALENVALVEAIEEGRRSEMTSREPVFDVLEGRR